MTNPERETKRKSDEDSNDNNPRQRFSEKVSKDIEHRFKSGEENAKETNQQRPKSGKGV